MIWLSLGVWWIAAVLGFVVLSTIVIVEVHDYLGPPAPPLYPPWNETTIERYQRWYVEGKIDLAEFERSLDRAFYGLPEGTTILGRPYSLAGDGIRHECEEYGIDPPGST